MRVKSRLRPLSTGGNRRITISAISEAAWIVKFTELSPYAESSTALGSRFEGLPVESNGRSEALA